MYRIRQYETTEADREVRKETAEIQTRNLLKLLLNAPAGNLDAQAHQDQVAFVEDKVFTRLREQYEARAPSGPVGLRKHQEKMLDDMRAIGQVVCGETYQEIADENGEEPIEVHGRVTSIFEQLVAKTKGQEVTFRKEYKQRFPEFRANAYPGLLKVIKESPLRFEEAGEREEKEPGTRRRRRSISLDNIGGLDGAGIYLRKIGQTDLLDAEKEVELSKRIEAGLIAGHALEKFARRLTETEKEELAWLAEDGAEAKSELYLANLRLVVSIAKRYRPRESMTLDDYIQEGNVGLMRGVEKFDFTKGYKFSTYATWWIKQRIGRAIYGQADMVKKPYYLQQQLSKLRKIETNMLNDGIEPTPELLAAEMKCEPEYILDLFDWRQSHKSLDEPLSERDGRFEDDLTLLSLLSLKSAETDMSMNDIKRQQDRDRLMPLLSELSPRCADIVLSRYGIGGNEPETLEEIGRRHGISSERVRQLGDESLAKLKRLAQDDQTESGDDSSAA